jgi:hypothetical protein
MLRLLRRLLSGNRHPDEPPRLSWQREEEEYEIEKAEREAQKERDRFAESLIEKAGHSGYPFLKDPFE